MSPLEDASMLGITLLFLVVAVLGSALAGLALWMLASRKSDPPD